MPSKEPQDRPDPRTSESALGEVAKRQANQRANVLAHVCSDKTAGNFSPHERVERVASCNQPMFKPMFDDPIASKLASSPEPNPPACVGMVALTANNTGVNTIDYKNTGIILRVLARANASGNVVLDIEQEIRSVAAGTRGIADADDLAAARQEFDRGHQRTDRAAHGSDQRNPEQAATGDTRSSIPFPTSAMRSGIRTNKKARIELIPFIRPPLVKDAIDASVIARLPLVARWIGIPIFDALSRYEPVPSSSPAVGGRRHSSASRRARAISPRVNLVITSSRMRAPASRACAAHPPPRD